MLIKLPVVSTMLSSSHKSSLCFSSVHRDKDDAVISLTHLSDSIDTVCHVDHFSQRRLDEIVANHELVTQSHAFNARFETKAIRVQYCA